MKTHGKQILSKANFTQRRYMHTSENMLSSHSLKKNLKFFLKNLKKKHDPIIALLCGSPGLSARRTWRTGPQPISRGLEGP